MNDEFAIRRTLLKTGLMLTIAAGAAMPNTGTVTPATLRSSKTLVAFFSRTGNTRLVARQIRRALDAVMFEIEPLAAYPEDYETTVDQAQDETKRNFEPPLRARVSGIASFETVFLGFPIWGMTAPPIIRSFLSAHDLKGKTLVPFITHGGYGRGDALKVLAQHAPDARLADGFVMQAEQEKKVLAEVTGWLGKRGPFRPARKKP